MIVGSGVSVAVSETVVEIGVTVGAGVTLGIGVTEAVETGATCRHWCFHDSGTAVAVGAIPVKHEVATKFNRSRWLGRRRRQL